VKLRVRRPLRSRLAQFALTVTLGLTSICQAAEYSHGFSSLGPLKYDADFEHFDYVNPTAPKAGVIRVPGYDTFDSFNHIIDKGIIPASITWYGGNKLLYDRLLEPAIDATGNAYGRLAEGVWASDDLGQAAFLLRDTAYWHDGTPLTVDDVIFTFESIRSIGSISLRSLFSVIENIERIGPREVLFTAVPGSIDVRDFVGIIGTMPIIPKHYWQSRDITKTTDEPPLGSGPYRVGEVDLGRKLNFHRVENYWGKDIAVNKGRYNFEKVKYDYFRDENVKFEALKADAIDIFQESVAANWTKGYDFPAVRAGYFKKELIDLSGPKRLTYPLMWNLDKEKFQDVRIREALSILYDSKWINRVINDGFNVHANSYFPNSPMAQRGLPSPSELKLLEPWRGQVPERVFTTEWIARESSGYGYDRDVLKHALELFATAGWEIKAGTMINIETGEPFFIEFVHPAPTSKRVLGSFLETLNRVGIETVLIVPEVSNWYYRVRSGVFDGTNLDFAPSSRPGQLLKAKFGSAAAEGPWGTNWNNVRNPAVDAMIELISTARDPEVFYSATRALDRILLWNFYNVPAMVAPGVRLAYWNRFGMPQGQPRLGSTAWLDTWWWDSEKSAQIDSGMAELTGKRRDY
jgi:microcin C transport system substrate-binding protein